VGLSNVVLLSWRICRVTQKGIVANYWIVTEYLYSFRNHSKFQEVSDWNQKRNKQIKDILSFYQDATKRKEPVLLSIHAGMKSVSVDDPVGISDLMDRMKELSDRIEEEHTQKSTFAKEPFKNGIPAISNYLSSKGINVKQSRALIIAYLYSVAAMPLKTNIAGERVPVTHDSQGWDDENVMKAALYYMR
jgi:hypothetical protein